MTTTPTHFLDAIFAEMRSRAEQPLLCEKQGAIYRGVTRRETVVRIGDFVHALNAAAVGAGDRVVFYAAASAALLISEWAVLANRGIAVIVPRSFSPEDLHEVLLESKSRLVIVDRLATAYHLVNDARTLPDLRHIVCLEGGGSLTSLPIWSWGDFIDCGRMLPDRMAASLRAITGKDTALMFYSKDQTGAKQATRYTHTLLLDHIGRIESLLSRSCIRPGELVLTATSWEQPIGHIATCYAPIPREAVIQITHAIPDVSLFENGPQVTVGDSAFFDGIRDNIQQLVRHSGRIETWMLAKAVIHSKQNYESPGGIRPLIRLQKSFLQATIIKKVKKMLGGRLRLLIGTDDEAHYETQLFFHTFGIELVELPQEAFR